MNAVERRKPTIVRFVRSILMRSPRGVFNVGEVAGFSPDTAARLVSGGDAVYEDVSESADEPEATGG